MAPARAGHALAITHVTLIDPTSGDHPDVTIIIDGPRIADVGPSSEIAIPAGAAVHDASGRFAVPGFWDAHVHLSLIGTDAIPLLVAHGVTGVRDMGSAFADVTRWRDMRGSGALVPRVFSSGPKLDGRGDEEHDGDVDKWVVTSPEAARIAVDRLKNIGVDFVKVHAGLSRPVYDAIATECRKDGLSFVGHVGREHPPLVAIAAGQRTIEHGGAMIPCSPGLRERLQAEKDKPWIVPMMCVSEADTDAILSAMVHAGTWFTPTLVSWRGRTLSPEAATHLDGMRYLPAALERKWGGPYPAPPPAEVELLSSYGPVAARAARTGVHLLVGSDSGDTYVVPGFALHDEMRLLVEAGVPPLVVLRGATLETARALGIEGSSGSIERGKSADLVLLDANPLLDIRNTRRITGVVLNGRLQTAKELAASIESLRRP